MAEHPNVQRIRDVYAALGAGDLGAAFKDLAPDAVFHFTGDGPNSGDHIGPEAISGALIKNFETTNGTLRLDVHHVFADDMHAVVACHETATRTDGLELDIEEVHVLTFDRQGRINGLWDLPTDPDVHDAFFDGPSA